MHHIHLTPGEPHAYWANLGEESIHALIYSAVYVAGGLGTRTHDPGMQNQYQGIDIDAEPLFDAYTQATEQATAICDDDGEEFEEGENILGPDDVGVGKKKGRAIGPMAYLTRRAS
jgi:hypothetical protein